MEKLQELIEQVLEITYGAHGAAYRKNLIETDKEKYYILKASGKLYEHIREKELEGENKTRSAQN